MTRLRVSTRFAVRGIWVHPDALGQAFEWVIDERPVTLSLPKAQDDFVNPDETEVPVVPAWVPTARIQGSGEAVSVQVFCVEVNFDGAVSAVDKERALASSDDSAEAQDFSRAAQGLWSSGNDTAVQVAHAWLAHIRVLSGQPWLGIAVERPYQYGRSHIFDHEAGVRLMSYGPMKKATIRSGQLALSLEQLSEAHDHVANERTPATADALLADARFLAQEAEVVDPQRAVLIAAAACEIKTKLTMSSRVDASRSALLDLVLGRVSNLPQLLDEPMAAALGVSLKDSNRELFDRISHLSSLRNGVVHRGVEVEANEAWRLVFAAGELFEWLEGLGQSAS